ncbi:MAG: RNA polymerase sigma factor [Bacillota bacterium]|jgi:RNA polymerase sigma-70 factor (ECF subfamily)|nr:RNA polymerase sigma factor [Bacillota bacterium]NLJ03303.1 RNA polymerase sigma factor [Bacillota bacterium]
MEPIDALKRREEAAIHWLVDSFSDRLLKAATLMLSDQHLAEDAVQECFAAAITHLDKFRGDSSVYTWLYTILLRCCGQLRKRSSRERVLPSEAMDGMLIQQGAQRAEKDQVMNWTVRNAVRKLKYKQREAVVLYYFEEFSIKEIAAILGEPEGTVKNRLHRARKALEKALEKEDSYVAERAF